MDISLLLTSTQTHSSLTSSTDPSLPSSLPQPLVSPTPSNVAIQLQENSVHSTASTTVDLATVPKQCSSQPNEHFKNTFPQHSANKLTYNNQPNSTYPTQSLPSFSNLAAPIPTQRQTLERIQKIESQQQHLQTQQYSHPISNAPPIVSSPPTEMDQFQDDKRNVYKPFRCTYPNCDATFGQKGSLTRHIRSRHEKLRPHTCELCQKSFSALWTLRVHQRNVHLKSKPHKCHLCDKSFGELFNKSKHIAIVHEGKRPFACPICSRAFGYKGDMRKHVLELHQQAGRPFQCIIPSCGVKFARKRYLRRHENLSHKGHPLLANRDRSSSPPISTEPTAMTTIANEANVTFASNTPMDAVANIDNNDMLEDQESSRLGVQELLYLGSGGVHMEPVLTRTNGQEKSTQGTLVSSSDGSTQSISGLEQRRY